MDIDDVLNPRNANDGCQSS